MTNARETMDYRAMLEVTVEHILLSPFPFVIPAKVENPIHTDTPRLSPQGVYDMVIQFSISTSLATHSLPSWG